MSGPVQYDPAELDRTAVALARAGEAVAAQANTVRSAINGMKRFGGPNAEQTRKRVDAYAKGLDRAAKELKEEAQSFRRLAQAVKALPRG